MMMMMIVLLFVLHQTNTQSWIFIPLTNICRITLLMTHAMIFCFFYVIRLVFTDRYISDFLNYFIYIFIDYSSDICRWLLITPLRNCLLCKQYLFVNRMHTLIFYFYPLFLWYLLKNTLVLFIVDPPCSSFQSSILCFVFLRFLSLFCVLFPV